MFYRPHFLPVYKKWRRDGGARGTLLPFWLTCSPLCTFYVIPLPFWPSPAPCTTQWNQLGHGLIMLLLLFVYLTFLFLFYCFKSQNKCTYKYAQCSAKFNMLRPQASLDPGCSAADPIKHSFRYWLTQNSRLIQRLYLRVAIKLNRHGEVEPVDIWHQIPSPLPLIRIIVVICWPVQLPFLFLTPSSAVWKCQARRYPDAYPLGGRSGRGVEWHGYTVGNLVLSTIMYSWGGGRLLLCFIQWQCQSGLYIARITGNWIDIESRRRCGYYHRQTMNIRTHAMGCGNLSSSSTQPVSAGHNNCRWAAIEWM